MTATIQADVGLFLATYIRREIRRPEMLAAYPVLVGFEVALVEPLVDSLDFPEKLIVVRDDGTSADPLLTGSTSVGISVLMGDPGETTESSEAARVVHAIVRECARVEAGNPVAAVVASNGPYLVPETQPRARWYSTHELRTVETALGVDTLQLPPYSASANPGEDVPGFEYIQLTPLATWTIPHVLGHRPDVAVYLTSGEQVEADVTVTLSTVVIIFATPTSGYAVLN